MITFRHFFLTSKRWRKQKTSFNHTGELNTVKHAVEWKHNQYSEVRINDFFLSLWIRLTIVQMKRKITFFCTLTEKKHAHMRYSWWFQNNAFTIPLNYYARDHSDDTHPKRSAQRFNWLALLKIHFLFSVFFERCFFFHSLKLTVIKTTHSPIDL